MTSSARALYRVPSHDVVAQNISVLPELLDAMRRVVLEGDYLGGETPAEVAAFESELAAFTGAPHVVAVSSGTAALELALRAVGVGPGDEVLTVGNTFVATAGAVRAVGATPRYAPIDPLTGLMNTEATEALVGPRTRAVLPVHLHGDIVDMDPLLRWARRTGLAVVEDAAHSMSARDATCHAGLRGDAGALSFYPTKGLGGIGEGGAVITRDGALASHVRAMRQHGDPGDRHVGLMAGTNARIGALEAAILRLKLGCLPARQAERARAATHLRAALDTAMLTRARSDVTHGLHLFVVRLGARDRALSMLRERGIEAKVHYRTPIFDLPGFKDATVEPATARLTRDWCARVLTLPLSSAVDATTASEIASVLHRAETHTRRCSNDI